MESLVPDWDNGENDEVEAVRQALFLRFMHTLREQHILDNGEKVIPEIISEEGLRTCKQRT